MSFDIEKFDEDAAIAFVKDTSLEAIEMIEDRIVDSPLNQINELNGNFLVDKLCNGLYARALTIPKGVFLTGKIHKKDYIDIFISGDVTVKSYMSDGSVEEAERVNSFRFFEGKAGRKRSLFAHEDTLWVTVDPTMANSVDETESDITVNKIVDYNKMIEVVV